MTMSMKVCTGGERVDDLSSRVTTLQRLSLRELKLLRLRCDGLSTSEIAERLETGQRDIMLQLAQVYDSLWLTHLTREQRLETLTSFCAAATYMHANNLLPNRFGDAAGTPQRIAPPQAAVVAVIADEQQMLTSRTAHAALAQEVEPEPTQYPVPESVATPEEAEAALLVPADRDASLVRLALISTAIIVIVVVAVALLFLNGGASSANTPASSVQPTETVTPSPTSASTATPTEQVAVVASPSPPPASPTRKATSTPTRTPTPVPPTATSIPPTPGPNVLYQSDWSSSLTDWTANGNWSVQDGILIYTGGQGSGVIYSPFQPQGGQSYVVEAEVQIDNPTAAGAVTGFAIGDPNAPTGNPLRVATYWVPDTAWHTYRLTVDGEKATLTVDGQFAGQIIDATYANAGKVGIYTNASRLQARRFTITDRP
jgi:hypothetical protein